MNVFVAAASAVIMSLNAPNGDQMADFSRVGYRWGDVEIPTVKVVKKLKAPKNGEDATALIQDAIDNVRTPGAILLKAGTYYIDGELKILRSGVVLRGEGIGRTTLVCRGKGKRTVVTVGGKLQRTMVKNTTRRFTEEYVPFGRLYAEVDKASVFKPGDRVMLEQMTTDEWIHAIRMDRIEQDYDALGRLVKQWKAKDYHLKWERIVAKVEGNKVYFDNPIALGINKSLSPCKIYKIETNRVSECGVEDMSFVSEYDPEKKAKYGKEEYCCDEDHGWNAVHFAAAEHCWARNLDSKYFGYAITKLTSSAKNCTVENCHSHLPVSKIAGGRRYAFAVAGAQLCLVKNCTADHDRHGFVVNGQTPGPNVFTEGSQEHCYSDIGPHNRFATCCLYDHVSTDGTANARDRGSSGFGHGWAGANMVFWNCKAKSFIIQNVWDVAKNYMVGCEGKNLGTGGKDRPEGVILSHGKNVEPLSLYQYQLQQRKAAGIKAVPEECYK